MPTDQQYIKTWLRRYGELLNDANCLYDRVDALRSRVEAPRSTNIDGMPRSHSNDDDRIGAAVAQLEELEQEAAKALAQATAVRHEIEAAVGHLKEGHWANKRAVIRCRYIDMMRWEDVAELLFGDNPKFWDTTETYVRRAHKIHGQALAELAKYVPTPVGQEMDQLSRRQEMDKYDTRF